MKESHVKIYRVLLIANILLVIYCCIAKREPRLIFRGVVCCACWLMLLLYGKMQPRGKTAEMVFSAVGILVIVLLTLTWFYPY